MADLVYYLTNILFFGIPLLYYYINLRSWIWKRDISFFRYFLVMLICNCFWVVLLRSFWDFFISVFTTNQITSCSCCFFWIILFEKVLSASVADCLAWPRCSWVYSPLKFSLNILPIFFPIFLVRNKNP